MDTASRSFLKALTWRVIAVIITTTIAFCITKRAEIALSIGAIDTVVKIVVYYVHERTWNRLNYGRKNPVEVKFKTVGQ